ncbi:DUF6461 domain-containing protein [Actinokineospora sp. 24-640]
MPGYFDDDPLDDSGVPTWVAALGDQAHDPNHLVHVVRDLEPAEALELLGAAPASVRRGVVPDERGGHHSLARAALHPWDPTAALVAARVGDWTFVYDDLGETLFLWQVCDRPPLNATAELSRRGEVAATANVTLDGRSQFAYAVGGDIVFHAESHELAEDAGSGPAEVRAAVRDVTGGHHLGLPMRALCALAGLPRTLAEVRALPLLVGAVDH